MKAKYTIEDAAKAGISFSVNIKTPAGHETVSLSLELVEDYISNTNNAVFSASHFGLSETNYKTWV